MRSQTTIPRWTVAVAVAVTSARLLSADALEGLGATAQAELKQALAELAAAQEEVASDKVPLTRQLNELEEQVLSRRTEFERAQRAQDNQLVDLGVLRKEVERAREERKFVEALLGEYLSRFETRIHISEADHYAPLLGKWKAVTTKPDLTPAERLEGQMELLDESLARLERVLGGDVFDGKALTAAGRMESGKYLLAGPVSLFASADSDTAGVAELRVGSPKPRAIAIGREHGTAIRELLADGRGDLPLDATGGNALKIAATKQTVWEHIRKGGPVMAPILLLGAAALVICGIKWSQISRIRMVTPMDLQGMLAHLRQGKNQAALEQAQAIPGPVGELLATAVEHAEQPKEYIEEVLYEKLLDTKPKLEALLPIIALTAACAPLLGLLGTVTGMINTFNMITVFGAGDPRTLSGGISEALITTEFGLIVAIPALLIHAFLSRKVKGVLGSMEQTTVAFINGAPTPALERA
jgi:biopolymer transport protein ExbB